MQNMKQAALILAMGLVSITTQAESVKIYGQLNVSAQSSDEGDGRFSELKSNSSRFGLKGDFELDAGLTLVYQLEWAVDLADVGGGDNITSRNQFVGLKGNFGEVRLGRHDTALKDAQGKIDLFNDYEADVKNLWRGEVRASNSVTYYTPTFNGFGVHLTYVVADAVDAEDAFSAAVYYGDDTLKDSNIYAAIAIDSDIAGFDAMRLHAQTKLSGVKLGAMYHTQQNIVSGLEQDGWLLSAGYPLGTTELKAQYQTLDDDDAVSVGIDYKAGNNTVLYAWYSSFNLEAARPDRDYLAVGIKHKF